MKKINRKIETKIYGDGRKYVGSWKNGKRDGQGIVTWPDGKVQKGIFKKGEIIKNKISK